MTHHPRSDGAYTGTEHDGEMIRSALSDIEYCRPGQRCSGKVGAYSNIDMCQYRAMSKQSLVAQGACCSPLADEPLTEDWAGDLARMFKALGDPVRLRLLSLVASHAGGEACVCDISGSFELSQPTISHHLKVLRAAGLVDCERRGTWVYYRVLPSALVQLSAVLSPESGVLDGSVCESAGDDAVVSDR